MPQNYSAGKLLVILGVEWQNIFSLFLQPVKFLKNTDDCCVLCVCRAM
jgi:hypothetical protein